MSEAKRRVSSIDFARRLAFVNVRHMFQEHAAARAEMERNMK